MRGLARRMHAPAPTLSAGMLGSPAKVHIGASVRTLAGWIDTDVHGAAVRLDLLSPWPVPPNSIDYVYGDNVIEHFDLATARTVLGHIASAMRGGGTLRLSTPDAERAARQYLHGGPDLEAVLGRHRRAGYAVDHPVDVVRVLFAESGHHRGYIFDWQSLVHELGAAGFTGMRRCRVGQSSDPELRGLELRDAPEDDLWSLVIEADAPG